MAIYFKGEIKQSIKQNLCTGDSHCTKQSLLKIKNKQYSRIAEVRREKRGILKLATVFWL